MPSRQLDDTGLDLIFRGARTRNAWQDKPVPEAMFHAVYDLAKWGPTSANSCPGRFVFVRSVQAKERLRPHLMEVNVDKTMRAPCCVIVAYDTRFYDLMPKLFPSRDFRSGFAANATLSEETAIRNGTLQGAYFIIAARALGLDCGPMSGFNRQTLDAEFFPDGRWRSNFLCNIGYGSDENLFPRNPRLDFDEACLVLRDRLRRPAGAARGKAARPRQMLARGLCFAGRRHLLRRQRDDTDRARGPVAPEFDRTPRRGGVLRVHAPAQTLVAAAAGVVEALDLALEQPSPQVVFLHRDHLQLKQGIEGAQQVIGLFDQLQVAIGQRRDDLGGVTQWWRKSKPICAIKCSRPMMQSTTRSPRPRR